LAAADDAAGTGGPAPDEVMTRLLLAARVDELAARVVLQRMLPGLVGCARKWTARRRGGSAEAFDELLSVAWTVIREFPVERRPHHLASNLLRDSEHRAFRRAARRLLVHELTPPHDFDLPAAPTSVDAAAELAAIVDGATLLTDVDRRLLGLVLKGRSQAEIAAELEVSERTVRNYRDSVVHRLRVAALAA
jgi:RNA polymerase sigma factor (sigma-70 family)